MTECIGFIGAGLMGHGVAKCLLEAGHPLTVIAHRNRAPIEDLVERCAKEVTSVAALTAASDAVFLCLPDAAAVERVITGEQGVLSSARSGQVIVDMTTSKPDVTQRLGETLAAKGLMLLDAPMSRTPKEAELGQLNLIVGGEPAAFARMRPVFEVFCENTWHVGPLGAGHAFKLLNNFLVIANLATVMEAAVAAQRFGIDHNLLLEICRQGGAYSAMLDKIVPYAISGDGSRFQAHTSTLVKDLTYFNQMADDVGLATFMPKAAHQFFQLACALGHGETMVPELYDVFVAMDGKPSPNATTPE